MTAIGESSRSAWVSQNHVAECLLYPGKQPLGYYCNEGPLVTQSGRQ